MNGNRGPRIRPNKFPENDEGVSIRATLLGSTCRSSVRDPSIESMCLDLFFGRGSNLFAREIDGSLANRVSAIVCGEVRVSM